MEKAEFKVGDRFRMAVGPVEVVEIGNVFSKVTWTTPQGIAAFSLIDTNRLRSMEQLRAATKKTNEEIKQ